MGRRTFDALFIDFYGTITSGDRQAVEETSGRVVGDLELGMSPSEFSVEWGKKFFAAADRRNHGGFRKLFDIECDTLTETLVALGISGVDPVPYVRHLSGYWSNPTLHADSVEALGSLDVPVCVVSNADTADLMSAIDKHGLRFDHLVTSEATRCYKPAPTIFQRALAIVGLPPERVAHAGDSLHADVYGAAALGITTIWVCRTGRIYDVGTAKPDHKIRSLLELGDIIA
jgi:2-haloalkanoic acid dehalogenase type II